LSPFVEVSSGGTGRPMALWTEPIIHWHPGVDAASQHRELVAAGQLLTTWQPAPFEESPTDCFRLGDAYWIWQPGVGGIRFFADTPQCTAYPAHDVDSDWFANLITRSWLPAVYLVWGRQVLHASAAMRTSDGRAVAFVGPSGAGKSTIAYGLSRRPGWTHVSDDTLAFSVAGPAIALHPLRNDARLRSATAEYFGRSAHPVDPIEWPDGALTLSAVYLLESEADGSGAVTIATVKAADAYTRLLEQAHAFTLEIPSHNQRLMRDYLALAAAIPAFRLTYRRSFDAMEEILEAVDRHASS